MRRRLAVGAGVLLWCLWASGPVFAEVDDPYQVVVSANEAFAAGRYDQALAGYESAAEVLGDAYELDYNRAAAHYKLGHYQAAAELFARTAMSPDAALSGRSRFGWGNCDYASALADLESADLEGGQPPDLQGGIEKLKSAIGHYRDALAHRADLPTDHPADRAARENVERAQKLIEVIQKALEQQQQQQQGDSPEQDQQQQDQQDQQDGEQDEQQQQSDEQQQEGQEDQQQQQGREQQQEQTEEQRQQAEQQEAAQPQQDVQQVEAGRMTPQESEALLQAVRDKEKKRREEKLRRMRARRVPVVKDW